MKIGSITLDNQVIAAPLAGISDLPFRLLAKEAGCALVCSEMISANGLVYGSKKTEKLVESVKSEKPLSVQIFGSDPKIMAEAAKIVESFGPDILDINFGCSVRKVVKTGSGVALMRTPEKVAAILEAVRNSISIPLTIKIRTGWEIDGSQAMEIAKIACNSGVDAITVHPRTASQGFGGHADWTLISKLKKILPIPVIGNGDIIEPEDAVRMLSETGCDFIMIGRAAIGNPWIFALALARICGEAPFEITLSKRFDTMKKYLRASISHYTEKHACQIMRSRLGWFVKGLPNSSQFRESIKRLSTESEALTLMDNYLETLLFREKVRPWRVY